MLRATFMPRPPPPKAALIAIGTPYSLAKATTSSASFTGSGVPGTSGAWARAAMWRAVSLGAGPDPEQAGVDPRLGEVGVLRQKAVAWVNRVGAGLLGSFQQLAEVEVG